MQVLNFALGLAVRALYLRCYSFSERIQLIGNDCTLISNGACASDEEMVARVRVRIFSKGSRHRTGNI